MDATTLWAQYLAALGSKSGLASGEALQIMFPYEPWDWGGQSPTPNSTSYAQWSALNVVPAVPGGNSNAASAQSGFDTAYQNWFNALTIGNLSKDQNYVSLQNAAAASLNKWQTDISTVQSTWMNQSGGGTTQSFKDWLAANPAYSAELDADQNDYQAKYQELLDYQGRIQGPINAIVSTFNDSDYQGYVVDPDSGKQIQVRLWSTDPANAWAYVYPLTGQNFGGPATAGTAGSFSFNQQSSSYSFAKSYGGGDLGLFADFFGIDAGGTFKAVSQSSFSSEYTVEIGYQDLKRISVQPDGWYAGANLTSYGRGNNYATGFSGFQAGSDNYFFGSGGALSRIYTGFVVIYRPTVTITAGASFASYLEAQFKQESGLYIGPFFFGSETTTNYQKATASASGSTFTISSNDNWPLIMAFVSAWTLAPQS